MQSVGDRTLNVDIDPIAIPNPIPPIVIPNPTPIGPNPILTIPIGPNPILTVDPGPIGIPTGAGIAGAAAATAIAIKKKKKKKKKLLAATLPLLGSHSIENILA